MKRFNFDELLWFIVLILLDTFLIYLQLTNKINIYIGSNMLKYMYLAIGMISVISIFQIKNIFTCKGNSSIKIKIVPIIVALILGVFSVNKLETFKHAELGRELVENKIKVIDKESLYEHEFNYNLSEGKKENLNNSEQDLIKVDENNPMILEDIRINPEKYIKKQLEISGFVCKENYLNKNQFIIGRIVMTCCAADSKIIGIIGEYDKIYDLKENDNVKVIGIIGSSTVKDDKNVTHNVPVIKVKELIKQS